MNKKTVLAFLVTALAMYFSISYISRMRGNTEANVVVEKQEVKPVGTLHKVVLTADGFQPEEVTIVAGETVEWSTTRNEFFWPASNLHPTHLLYPAFDPQQPLGKEETWSFRFDKEGDWKYHDHLAPYFTGIVHVGAVR